VVGGPRAAAPPVGSGSACAACSLTPVACDRCFASSPCAGRGWAWALWEATIPLPKGTKGNVELVCKATDESYNTQVG
jgi:hypothetical protein